MNTDLVRTAVAAVFVAAGSTLAVGPLGVLPGIATLLVLLVRPGVFGVLAVQLLVAASATEPPLAVALAEVGVLLALTRLAVSRRHAVALAALFAVLVGLWTGWVWSTTTPLVAALTLLLPAALAVYGLHRYELVRLDLITHE